MENNLSFNSAQKQTLPNRPTDFVLFFVKQHWRLFAPMAACEFLHSGIGVLAPYALTEIVRSMGSHTSPDALHNALILFTCFTISEILFGRAAGALQLRLAPIQRQSALRSLYDCYKVIHNATLRAILRALLLIASVKLLLRSTKYYGLTYLTSCPWF